MAPWTPFVEVHWSPRAEAYVTPVGDDCVGVAVLVDGGGDFDDLLAGFPALAERLTGRRRRGCSAPGRCGSGPAAGSAGRVLLVGDAPATSTR